MATGVEATEIEFVGPPRRLIAVGGIPDLDGSDIGIEGDAAAFLEDRRSPLRARRTRGQQALKLRLRRDTPPGDYDAVLRAGDRTWPAVIHVLPQPDAQLTPATLSFTGAPGGRVTCLGALINDGNVPVELPKLAPVGIFDDNGIESAFAATYAREADDFDDFFKAFHGRLREAHGGLMKLSLQRGAGSHPPGASVTLEIVAQLPEKLVPGHRYHGFWNTGLANVPVNVTASK